MSSRQYYTLVASLPLIPRFDRAERLPITREQLLRRLSMLESEDAQLLERLESYLFWLRQPRKESDLELEKQYCQISKLRMSEELRNFVIFRVSERTIMVALRRKFRGFPAPRPGETWGLGRWVKHIEKNWDDPYFRLAHVQPWIPKAKELLYSGETLELERFILNYAWKLLDQFSIGKNFLLETVAAYLFKWNILNYWLGFNPEAAKERFIKIVGETYDENAKFIRFS